jgi:hypothetical protein
MITENNYLKNVVEIHFHTIPTSSLYNDVFFTPSKTIANLTFNYMYNHHVILNVKIVIQTNILLAITKHPWNLLLAIAKLPWNWV